MTQSSSSMKTQPIPLHHTHTTPTLALKLCHVMLCHLASSHCLTSKRYSNERFLFISFCSFPVLSYICFHNFKLSCCIAIIFSVHLTIGLNCAHTLPNSIQNAGRTRRPLLYITCYFKVQTNEFQHSRLELNMPCHAPFFHLATWRFGSAGLGLAEQDPVGLVWYGTSCMNFWCLHIFKHHTLGKKILL